MISICLHVCNNNETRNHWTGEFLCLCVSVCVCVCVCVSQQSSLIHSFPNGAVSAHVPRALPPICNINNSKLPPYRVLTLSLFSVFVCHCGLGPIAVPKLFLAFLRVSLIKDSSENSKSPSGQQSQYSSFCLLLNIPCRYSTMLTRELDFSTTPLIGVFFFVIMDLSFSQQNQKISWTTIPILISHSHPL